eukprot:4190322-Amphidinium_carterae.1
MISPKDVQGCAHSNVEAIVSILGWASEVSSALRGPRKSVWSDTDHAGCVVTKFYEWRGDVPWIQHCRTLVSHSTYSVPFSGESTLHGVVKAYTEGLGLRTMAIERGCGKIKRLQSKQLWIQQEVGSASFKVERVSGITNMSDILTKACRAMC